MAAEEVHLFPDWEGRALLQRLDTACSERLNQIETLENNARRNHDEILAAAAQLRKRELDLESQMQEHSEALKSIAAREEALREGEGELQRRVEISKIEVELRDAEFNSIGKRLGYREDDLTRREADIAASGEARDVDVQAALDAQEGELLAREARVMEEEEKLAEHNRAIDSRIVDLEKAAQFLEKRQVELRSALGGGAPMAGMMPVQREEIYQHGKPEDPDRIAQRREGQAALPQDSREEANGLGTAAPPAAEVMEEQPGASEQLPVPESPHNAANPASMQSASDASEGQDQAAPSRLELVGQRDQNMEPRIHTSPRTRSSARLNSPSDVGCKEAVALPSHHRISPSLLPPEGIGQRQKGSPAGKRGPKKRAPSPLRPPSEDLQPTLQPAAANDLPDLKRRKVRADNRNPESMPAETQGTSQSCDAAEGGAVGREADEGEGRSSRPGPSWAPQEGAATDHLSRSSSQQNQEAQAPLDDRGKPPQRSQEPPRPKYPAQWEVPPQAQVDGLTAEAAVGSAASRDPEPRQSSSALESTKPQNVPDSDLGSVQDGASEVSRLPQPATAGVEEASADVLDNTEPLRKAADRTDEPQKASRRASPSALDTVLEAISNAGGQKPGKKKGRKPPEKPQPPFKVQRGRGKGRGRGGRWGDRPHDSDGSSGFASDGSDRRFNKFQYQRNGALHHQRTYHPPSQGVAPPRPPPGPPPHAPPPPNGHQPPYLRAVPIILPPPVVADEAPAGRGRGLPLVRGGRVGGRSRGRGRAVVTTRQGGDFALSAAVEALKAVYATSGDESQPESQPGPGQRVQAPGDAVSSH